MTEPLPAPPLPATVDLREFSYMPLDVARLRDSDLAALETAEAFRAAVLLWAAAWHQIPAGSLPDDDRILAKLAGFGRVLAEWRKVKDGAMRGFVKCSDGRLYHQVVAEKALDAWRSRLEHRWTNDKAAEKKRASRAKREPVYLPFPLWITANCPEAIPYLSRWTKETVPEDTAQQSQGKPDQCPGSVPGEKPSKGIEGKGSSSNTYRGNGESIAGDQPPAGCEIPTPKPEASDRILAECTRAKLEDPTAENAIVGRWISSGATPTQVATALAEARRYKPAGEPLEARYVNPIIERIVEADRRTREQVEARVKRTQDGLAELRQAKADPMPESVRAKIPRTPTGEPDEAAA